MSFQIPVIDIILFLICFFRAYFNLTEWSNYSTCAAPIQIFLVLAPLTIMITILTFHLLRFFLRISRARKCLDFIIIFVLTPFCCYLFVQGVIWQIIIQNDSSNCPVSRTTWIWIFLLFFIAIHFVKITYLLIKRYWRNYRIRQMMNQFTENGDFERFYQILIQLGEAENNKIGLLSADIERLEKVDYQQDNSVENCAICLVEFKAEDKVITLPKCEHIFHAECVKDWLKKKPLCPMCRGNVRNGMMDVEMQVRRNQYRPPIDNAENVE